MFNAKQQALSKLADDLGVSNPELCKICFEPGEKEDYFKCKLCPIERKKGAGYSNLSSHLLEKHSHSSIKDFVSLVKGSKAGPMNLHVKGLSEDAKAYHDWIEWVVMCNHPFTFVENEYTRKNSKLGEISKKTLLDYMEKVESLFVLIFLIINLGPQ